MKKTFGGAGLVIAMLLALALLDVGPAEAQTVITGDYKFTSTETCPPTGVCVDIVNSNIQVNGAGHVVDCNGGPATIGVQIAAQTKVHLHSLEVKNCGIGVLIQGGGQHHLNEMNVHDNMFGTPGPGDGIQLVATGNNHVNGSLSVRNQAFGVRLLDSHDNTFNTMVVVDNVGPPTCGGYALHESHRNIISSNDIATNGDVGVWIRNGKDNIVRSSVVDRTNFFGTPTTAIAITGDSDFNIIRGNQANGNQNGISLGCPAGCAFISGPTASADFNIIQSNVASMNIGPPVPLVGSGDGIEVAVGNMDNLLQSNTALGNPGVDLRDNNPNCDNNTWKSNTFLTDSEGDGPAAGCIQ